jgi:hypothetical protein
MMALAGNDHLSMVAILALLFMLFPRCPWAAAQR